jgi:hypothetical protein
MASSSIRPSAPRSVPRRLPHGVYFNTSAEVGGADHLKVFADEGAAEK